tara:strand:+ start:2514 stop:4487 length:1974 start_codon:yes stop_codon:yes gene_type:complete
MIDKFKYAFFFYAANSRLFFPVLILFLLITFLTMGMIAIYLGLFSESALKAEGIDDAVDGGLIDAFWWSLKHIVDPGSFSEDYGAPLGVLVLAFLNTILGLVITSMIIAYVVNLSQSFIEDTQKGKLTIREKNHFLILGWNRKGIALLYFLSRLGKKVRVVIMTSLFTELVRKEIRYKARKMENINVLTLQGAIESPSDLERLAIKRASHIVILAEDYSDGTAVSDLTTLKTLMLLRNSDVASEATDIVAELIDSEKRPIATAVSSKKAVLLSTSEVTSKVSVQCLRYPGYTQVYDCLFSGRIASIELIDSGNFVGKLFGNVAKEIVNMTAIGVSWLVDEGTLSERRVNLLNPEFDFDIGEDDQIIVMSNVSGSLSDNQRDEGMDIGYASISAPFLISKTPDLRKVLIFSYTESTLSVIKELESHCVGQLEIVLACKDAEKKCVLLDRNLEAVSRKKRGNVNLTPKLTPFEFDVSKNWTLKSTELAGVNGVLILADQSVDSVDADSRTALVAILLGEQLAKLDEKEQIPVVAEILDPRTKELLDQKVVTDIIISTNFMSSLIVGLTEKPFVDSIYRELLNAGGVEMRLREITLYSESPSSAKHVELIDAALKRKETLIGYVKSGGSANEIVMNPSERETLELGTNDRAIVLGQQVYI